MPTHRFNPLSALLGIVIIALGVMVAVFGFDEIDNDPVIWGAAITVFVALILLAIPTRLKPPPDDA
jgi:hypothetical protein